MRRGPTTTRPMFVGMLPRSFWAQWADRLLAPADPDRLLTVCDLHTTPQPPRSALSLDPRLGRILGARYDARHPDYAETVSSWAHYTTRPICPQRATALAAMSASAFMMDDLVDGWQASAGGIDLREVMCTQERLVDALARRDHGDDGARSAEFRDALAATRRASDLAHALRPNDRWWSDYVAEMASFVYGRSISPYLHAQRFILPPDLYLRARILDVGASMATTFASLAVDAYPERRRGLAELWAACWLHLIATNDLYSYYRERDESAFNIVHVVQATLSRVSATSAAQAVDRVVRLCNRLLARVLRLADRIVRAHPREAAVADHVRAVVLTVTGGLAFLHAHPSRYRDPASLPDYHVALHRVADAYGQRWWGRRHWPEAHDFVEAHRPTERCREAWRFALGGDRSRAASRAADTRRWARARSLGAGEPLSTPADAARTS